jgi:hypothetical protein
MNGSVSPAMILKPALPIEMRLIRLRLMRYRLRLALLLRAARLFAAIGERLHGL